MFKQYLSEFEKENNSNHQNIQGQPSSSSNDSQQQVWDDYIDRQLEHLVVEYQFDFEKIATRLSGVVGDKQQVKINNETCRQRWKVLHLKRYEDKDKDRLDRVSKSVMKFEDPINALTVQEMVDKLPKERQNKDFLNISDNEKLQAFFTNDKGEKVQPTTFNVLKDSVMGIKDKNERERVFKKQQEEFFKNLDRLAVEQDDEMFVKPLIFRAKFTEPTNFIVEREELTKEHAQKIMSQKVQMKGSGIVPPEPEMGIKMDNYVSMFARPAEDEEDLKRKEQETDKAIKQDIIQEQIEIKEEQEMDQADLVKQMEQTEEEKKKQQEIEEEKKKINVDLYLAERGLKSIDEAVNQLEKMRSKVKVNNYFEDENKRVQEEQQKRQVQQVQIINQGEDQIRQEVIKQGLASLKQKESGDQLVQFHENQIKKDIRELSNIIGDNPSKAKEPLKPINQEEIELNKKTENTQKVPLKKGIFSQFNEDRDSDSENDDEEDQSELDDELYIQAQRMGLKTDEEIDNYISKKKEERQTAQLSKKKVQFSEIAEEKSITEDPSEILAKQEKQIQQKQQFLEKLKKKKENQIGEGNEEKEADEPNENWKQLEFSAGIAFKKQLEEEQIQRTIKEQFEEEEKRKAALERIKEIQEEYQLKKLDIEDKIKRREPINLEKANSEKWKEYLEVQQKRREEIEREFEEKQRQQQLQEEKDEKENLIKEKITYYESKIKQFQTNDPFRHFFDEQISYLSNISSLPPMICQKISDLKKYDISRDGITSRYQILTFPYLEKCSEFVFSFLGFFLRNSFLRQTPSEQEGESSVSNSLGDIQSQRVSSKGFPFSLVSFFVGSYSSEISDEQEEQYISSYLNDGMKLDRLINEEKFQKCIYLFFDTHLGRGQQTFSSQLDIPLTQFLPLSSIHSANAKYGDAIITPQMNLNQFKLAYYNNMEIAKKLFIECNTFHSICPTKTSYHSSIQLNDNNNNPSPKQKSHHSQQTQQSSSQQQQQGSIPQLKQWDTSVIIIRQFSEIQKPSSSGQQQQNEHRYDVSSSSVMNHFDQTTEQTSSMSDAYSTLVPSQTELSQRQKSQMTDVINYTLNRLQQKGIQILGIKSFFFDSKSSSEFKTYIENIHFTSNPNQPLVVIAVAGHDIHAKLKKMVGSEDAQLAKRLEPNSLNALFAQGRDDSIITPYNKTLSKRLISYFFSGRLEKIQSVLDIQIIEGLTNKKQLYLTKPQAFNPVFLLNSQPVKEHICILSSKFLPKDFSEVLRKVQARGFQLIHIRVIDTSNLSSIIKKDEDFKAFIENEGIQELNGGENEYERINLVLHISGVNVSSLRDYLLKKIIDYNPFFHPSKREIFYYTNDETQLNLLRDLLLSRHLKSNFTPSERFPLFIALWPFLNDHKEGDIQQVNLGNDLKIFTEYGLELLSIARVQQMGSSKLSISLEGQTEDVNLSQLLRSLIKTNIHINSITKKKYEFDHYCTRLTDEILSQDFYFGVFRFQGDRQAKHFDKLFAEVPFVYSNKTINETTVVTHGAKATPSAQQKPIPTEFLTLFFLDASSLQVTQFAKLLGVGVFDDWSFKGSFIFDLPSSGFTGEIETMIILSEDVVKTLLLQGLVRIIENNQFKIKTFFKHRSSTELIQVIHQNLLTTFSPSQSQNQDSGTKLQQIKASVDNLVNQLQGESVYFLTLSKENGIFNGKKMLFELAEKYSVFKKETVKADNWTEYILEKGMYSSLNYKSQQREFKELSFLSQQVLSMSQEIGADVSGSDKQYENQILMILRIDQQVQLYEIFRKLTTDLKFKILNFLVLRHLEWTDIQYLSTQFTPKFESSHILDSKNSVSISDAFGTLRLNENGEFKQVIRSSLFGKQDVFFIYTNLPTHVQKLSAYAFKSSE